MDPLKGPVARRACGHVIHTQCYFDKMTIAGTDASVNVDACEICRAEVCSKTRHGSTLVEHFSSSKALVTAPATLAKKDAPRRPRREPEGPRAGSAGSAGTGGHGKSKRRADDKAKKAKKKAKTTKGGYTLANRGDLRSQGIKISVGGENTCLPDAFWPLADHLRPELKLKLNEVRDAIMPGDGTDPCLHTAMAYAATLGMDLAARSDINSPRLLWSQDSGCYLAQLHVQTDDSADSHFVAYLADGGVLLDNYPGRQVPKMKTSDRTRKQAPKVFKQLFPSAQQTRLGAVFELRYTPVSYGAAISTDSCASGVSYRRLIGPPNPLSNTWSTKPTLEDLFFELYDEQIINYSELIDCIK